MSYADYHGEHIRLSTLRLLNGQGGYTANDSVLCQGVNQYGLACTRDQMRGHLRWLEEQGLLTIEEVGSGKPILVARLTERGQEVATGAAAHPGVQRPSPGS